MGRWKRWLLGNIDKEKKRPAAYKLGDARKRTHYVGSSRKAKNRLTDTWYGRSDHRQHKKSGKRRGKTKKKMMLKRRRTKYYQIKYMSTKKARAFDRNHHGRLESYG